MDQIPGNAIRPLLTGRGKLVESFEGVSDGQLRVALAQIIDGLERMDELADGANFVVNNWRTAKPDNEGWKREVARKLRPTPVIAPAEESHWDRFQWHDTQGKDCMLGQMTREDLELGIRQAWEFSRRFARMFNAAARDAKSLMAGEYLQAEWDKPEPEVPASPTRRSGGPR